MGRASNRKKARRQAGGDLRTAGSGSAGLAHQQAMRQLQAALEMLSREAEDRRTQGAAASSLWFGGREPLPASVPGWTEGSLGDRLLAGTFFEEARSAPSLLTCDVPADSVLVASPAHWSVATKALVRAIAFDGCTPDHVSVTRLTETLLPVVEAELAYGAAMDDWLAAGGRARGEKEPEFAELSGPVLLLGGFALVDATNAAVGDDPLGEVLDVLTGALDRAVVPGLSGREMAEALVAAFARHYLCEQRGDAQVLERIGPADSGNALENLATAGTLQARDILPAGLRMASVLAELCLSDEVSLLERAPA